MKPNHKALSKVIKEEIGTNLYDLGLNMEGVGVTGTDLLEGCGYSFTDSNRTSKVNEYIISKHNYAEGEHFIKIYSNSVNTSVTSQWVTEKPEGFFTGKVEYVFTSEAAAEAMINAQTSEGKANAKRFVEHANKLTKALQKSTEGHQKVLATKDIDEAHDVSQNVLDEMVRSGMPLIKPRHRIRKALDMVEGTLSDKVRAYLQATMNNREVMHEQRIHNSKSLLNELDEIYQATTQEAMKTCNAQKLVQIAIDYETAKGLVKDYQLKRERLEKSRFKKLLND